MHFLIIIGKDFTEDISTTSLISAACKIVSQVFHILIVKKIKLLMIKTLSQMENATNHANTYATSSISFTNFLLHINHTACLNSRQLRQQLLL